MKITITYDLIQEYILDNNLSDGEVIMLHPSDYDTVADGFMAEHDLTIYMPVEILGISIIEDTTGTIRKNIIGTDEYLAVS